MSITDSSFFDDNIVNNNKKVELVLYLTALVPVSFIIITLAGIWIVPHAYSFNIIVYSLISATICHFFNCQFLNKRIQILSMYIGIIASSGFVFLLAVKGIIIITVSYACVPFLSCIYYNRRLTIVTTIANFILAVISYWIRSPSVKLVEEGIFTANEWFLQYVIGLVIEFIFIFLIADFIARRTSRTLHTMVSYMEERDEAYKKLNTKNQEIVKLNRELTEKIRNLMILSTK